MPWDSITSPLPDGGARELAVRIKCPDDATAADDLSADMFPGADVWEGTRFGPPSPRHFPRASKAMRSCSRPPA
jgi:hypothetical protein